MSTDARLIKDRHSFRTWFFARRVELALLAAFALVSAVLALLHEPWRDEAQAWLFVRDQSLSQMLGNLNIEGHPALWFLLITPLVRLGLPYESLFVLHWALAVAAGALLVLRAPFKLHVRALLLFSYLVGFAFNVVARNYVLLELLLFAIASIFPQRYGRHRLWYGLLLALLTNTHVYGALAALALLAYDALHLLSHDATGRRRMRGRGIPVAVVALLALSGFAVLLLTLSGPRYASVSDPNVGELLTSNLLDIARNVLGYSFGSDNTSVLEILYKVSESNPLIIALMRFFDVNLLPLLALAVMLGRFKPALLGGLFLAPFSALLLFSSNVAYRHVVLFALMVLVGYWIAQTTAGEFPAASSHWDAIVEQARFRGVPLSRAAVLIVLVCSTMSYGAMAAIEATSTYSDGRNLARFLQSEGYDHTDTAVVTVNPEQVSAALPYLEGIRSVTVPGLHDEVSYLLWDKDYYDFQPAENDPFDYARWLHDQGQGTVLVVLASKAFEEPEDFRCIYDSRETPTVKFESYAVFVPDW